MKTIRRFILKLLTFAFLLIGLPVSSQNIDDLIGKDYKTVVNQLSTPKVFYGGSLMKDNQLMSISNLVVNQGRVKFYTTVFKYERTFGLVSYTVFVESKNNELYVKCIFITHVQDLYNNSFFKNTLKEIENNNDFLKLGDGYLTLKGNYIEFTKNYKEEDVYVICDKDYINKYKDLLKVHSINNQLKGIFNKLKGFTTLVDKSLKNSILGLNN